jgi:hypothetical protein
MLEIRKIVKTVKEPKNQILCHEIEPNLSKDRAMHEGDMLEGDNPSQEGPVAVPLFILRRDLHIIYSITGGAAPSAGAASGSRSLGHSSPK